MHAVFALGALLFERRAGAMLGIQCANGLLLVAALLWLRAPRSAPVILYTTLVAVSVTCGAIVGVAMLADTTSTPGLPVRGNHCGERHGHPMERARPERRGGHYSGDARGHGLEIDGGFAQALLRDLAGLLMVGAASLQIAREVHAHRRQLLTAQRGQQRREATLREKQRELEHQRAFLRQVIDINPHLVFAKDRAGRFTLVNEATAQFYGTTVEELTGKTDADFNPHPEQLAHFRHDDLEVMDTLREKLIPEEVVTDSHGTPHWFQTIKRPIIDADGRANQVLGIAMNIEDRKHAHELLQQEVETAATLAELGRATIAVLNQPAMADHLCRLYAGALLADFVQLWVLHPDEGDGFVPVAHYGDTPDEWESTRVFRIPVEVLEALAAATAGNDVQVLNPPQFEGLLPAPLRGGATAATARLIMTVRRGGEVTGASGGALSHPHRALHPA